MKQKKVALITGVTGQDGSYLLKYLLGLGYQVHGIKRRASSFNTSRIDEFYETETNESKNFTIHFGDLTDYSCLSRIITEILPDEIYHLGAMSHVKVSFDIPLYTAEVNALGTHKILEIIRSLKPQKNIKFYNASTSELYGKVLETPQSEQTEFYPRSPYAVSKLYAHWITKHYREAFEIFACNGILFNHESPVRGETFISRKITRSIASIAYEFSSELIVGNLDAKRDWGHASEYIKGMHKILQRKNPEDWVLGTGKTNTVRDFIKIAFSKIGVDLRFVGNGLKEVGLVHENQGNFKHILKGNILVKVSEEYFRPTEVDLLLANPKKANEELEWKASISLDEIIEDMVSSDLKEYQEKDHIRKGGFYVSKNILND